ncbi:MAG TPA: alpha/beta hydrolase [Pedobacter sp.]|nr:alpha/beta hydrolase [Pedobacter sp.]
MKDLYIFSGLGADERVFKFMDFSGFNTKFINWETPVANESIEAYAKRIASKITTSLPVIIGLSFGGIMAIEVAKLIETEKVILIASAKTRKEIPFYYRAVGFLRLHKLLPISIQKRSNFFTNWFFGIKSKSDKKLLKEILKDTEPAFLKWAIEKIVLWKNETLLKNTFHIHGTADRILPIKFIDFNVEIKNGGHLMTLKDAKEISRVIKQHLQSG